MSDIFISYKREEQEEARQLAGALERQGWSVWWDPKLHAGDYFDEVIEKALNEARCVIVLWSSHSVQSRYVRDEATYALDQGKLAPVAIEKIELPLRFRGIQTPQLIDWDGDESSADYQNLLDDITAILGPSPAQARQAQPRQVEIDAEQPSDLQAIRADEQSGKTDEEKNRPAQLREQSDDTPRRPTIGAASGTERPPLPAGSAARRSRSSLWFGIAAIAVVGIVIWLVVLQMDGDKDRISALLKQAEQALNEGSLDSAEKLLTKASKLDPDYPTVAKLRRVLERARQEQNQGDQRREEKILKLLERGRAAEDAQRLTAPAQDNAVDLYRGVLELDPENKRAQAGLQRVVEHYLDRAQRALDVGRWDEVEKNIHIAASVDPEHPRIPQLLDELAAHERGLR